MRIKQYQGLSPEEVAAKQLGRAGFGNARMNLGQLYRRTAAYTPKLRSWLAKKAREIITKSIEALRKEKDFRSLPMAIAAAVADDPAEVLTKKIEVVNLAIEYSKDWNQDAIQIGSAYFMKAQLLARADDLLASETCYLEALCAFRSAGMKAEIARTQIELAALESQLASQITSKTEGSAEWKFGSRMLGVAKILFRLAPVETALAVVGAILLMGAVIGFFFLGGEGISLY